MEAFAFTESFIRVKPKVGVLPALLLAIVIILFPRRKSPIRCRPLNGWVWYTIPKLLTCLNVLLLAKVLKLTLCT